MPTVGSRRNAPSTFAWPPRAHRRCVRIASCPVPRATLVSGQSLGRAGPESGSVLLCAHSGLPCLFEGPACDTGYFFGTEVRNQARLSSHATTFHNFATSCRRQRRGFGCCRPGQRRQLGRLSSHSAEWPGLPQSHSCRYSTRERQPARSAHLHWCLATFAASSIQQTNFSVSPTETRGNCILARKRHQAWHRRRTCSHSADELTLRHRMPPSGNDSCTSVLPRSSSRAVNRWSTCPHQSVRF